MKNKTLVFALGTSFVTAVSAVAVNAEENPFGFKEMTSGYTQLAEAGADKAPEAKCGAETMKKNPEMKCGASMMDMGKQSADAKAMALEKKCAGMKKSNPAGSVTPPPASTGTK